MGELNSPLRNAAMFDATPRLCPSEQVEVNLALLDSAEKAAESIRFWCGLPDGATLCNLEAADDVRQRYGMRYLAYVHAMGMC
jgi:hypothetical protein